MGRPRIGLVGLIAAITTAAFSGCASAGTVRCPESTANVAAATRGAAPSDGSAFGIAVIDIVDEEGCPMGPANITVERRYRDEAGRPAASRWSATANAVGRAALQLVPGEYVVLVDMGDGRIGIPRFKIAKGETLELKQEIRRAAGAPRPAGCSPPRPAGEHAPPS